MGVHQASAEAYHSERFAEQAGGVRRAIIRTVRDAGEYGLTRRQILDALRCQGWTRLEYGTVSGRVRDELVEIDSALYELDETRQNDGGHKAGIIVHRDYRPFMQGSLLP